MRVPAPMETMSEAIPAPRVLRFRCPSCSRKFATKPELAGQKIRCTKCGAGVRVPWADEDFAKPASQPDVVAYADVNQESVPPQPAHRDVARVDLRSAAPSTTGAQTTMTAHAEVEQKPAPQQPVHSDVLRVDVRSAAPSTSASQPGLWAHAEVEQKLAPRQPVRSDVPRVDVRTAAPSTTGAQTTMTAHAEVEQKPAPQQPVRGDVARVDLRSRNDEKAIATEQPIVKAPDLEEIAQLDAAKPRRPESVLSSRSELMEQVRQQAAEEEAVKAEKKVQKSRQKKKGKETKRKKYSSYFDAKETLKLVAGVGALVGVLAILAWGYPEFRFPLGGFLCVLGFIDNHLGSVSLRQLVAEEGVLKALMFRFCPPYQWWFVATHWEETRDFVAFFVAGAFVMSLGGAIIKISPTGRKAEASERAYQKLLKGKQSDAPPPVIKRTVDHRD